MRHTLMALLLAGPACAVALPEDSAADATAGWQAVDDARLERARGGFDNGNGVLVSLGVERLVSINGTVVSNSRFSIADMTQLSTDEARLAGEALSAVTVVRSGGGNLVAPSAALAMDGLGALVIQNSANDQAIRSQTTINTTVANLALLKALNFESMLRDSLSGAVGPK